MIEPITIPKFVTTSRAIRIALGKAGYPDAEQTLKPDLVVWAIEASDMISKPRTLVADSCDFEVEDNRILQPDDALMINCISIHNRPLTYVGDKGCLNLHKDSPCRKTHGGAGFYFKGCYIYFKPHIHDEKKVDVEWLSRPVDDEGYPLVLDSASMAISEYVASMVCLRFKDKAYQIWERKWWSHVRLARSDINRINEASLAELGELYHSFPRYQGRRLCCSGW